MALSFKKRLSPPRIAPKKGPVFPLGWGKISYKAQLLSSKRGLDSAAHRHAFHREELCFLVALICNFSVGSHSL